MFLYRNVSVKRWRYCINVWSKGLAAGRTSHYDFDFDRFSFVRRTTAIEGQFIPQKFISNLLVKNFVFLYWILSRKRNLIWKPFDYDSLNSIDIRSSTFILRVRKNSSFGSKYPRENNMAFVFSVGNNEKKYSLLRLPTRIREKDRRLGKSKYLKKSLDCRKKVVIWSYGLIKISHLLIIVKYYEKPFQQQVLKIRSLQILMIQILKIYFKTIPIWTIQFFF